jgi:cyclophilin family peptidyl-prolyl cis-trans isomerase
MTNTSRWVLIIAAAIVVLAGIQWWQNSRPTAPFNEYGNPPAFSVPQATTTPPVPSASTNSSIHNLMHTITIETTKGTIVLATYDADAPNTVKNFISLAQKGFYNGLIFHRVIEGFMIQGGDPTGTGMGGPGYKFADEPNASTDSYKAGYVRGTLAMANSGPDTNGSQFFIMHKDTPLPHNYTIFGKVVQGLDVVDAIASVPVNGSDRPLSDVKMTKVTVVENK